MLVRVKHDKLVDREKVDIFFEYVNEIDAFVKIGASDLGKVIRHNVVRFAEDQKKEHIDLKLKIKIINVLSERRPVKRLRKVDAYFITAASVAPINAQVNEKAEDSLAIKLILVVHEKDLNDEIHKSIDSPDEAE